MIVKGTPIINGCSFCYIVVSKPGAWELPGFVLGHARRGHIFEKEREPMKKNVPVLVLSAALALTLTACGETPSASGTPSGEPSAPAVTTPAATAPAATTPAVLDEEPLGGDMLADFSNGPVEAMFPSDGWSNGSVFNVWWAGSNVTYNDGQMQLNISPAGDDVEQDYYGGEMRTGLYYGYGDYSVSMKPSKDEGTASTFFTCTGPYDINADGEPNPWDEIDIEFLGKDTTGVQFNYYVDGQGGHEYWYELGFDASEEFHEYGFRWEEDSITWFVDGEAVYSVNTEDNGPMPSTPGRILMNFWCGTADAEGWMGAYSAETSQADYQWVKTSAQGEELVPTAEAE